MNNKLDQVITTYLRYSVVNGALEHLAKDLGIVENAVLQGLAYFYLCNLIMLSLLQLYAPLIMNFLSCLVNNI
jgi:hypothetical protein